MDAVTAILPSKQEIRYRVAQISDLPLRVGTLQRLLEIISSEVSSVRELESIIHFDQALSAKILRLANSSFYGMRGNVLTVAEAIMRIGFAQVESICLCTLLMQLCSDQSGLDPAEGEGLWKHAFATARIASLIAQTKPWMSKELAYALGLLHDLGRLAMTVHFNEYYRLISSLAESRKIPRWLVESEYGFTHREIGRWMCFKWALPEIYARVTEYHHQPDRSPSYGSEVKLVFLADVLANSGQFPEYVNDEFTLSCTRQLLLTEDDWEHCIERSSAVWPQVDAFWAVLDKT
jgi:putative nucleotidyltransferase with HDIG domain